MEIFEISENKNIRQLIMNTDIAKNWSIDDHKPYKLVTLDSNSMEYYGVSSKFVSTYTGCIVRKIERIENPYLLGHYLLKKEQMQETSIVTERFMFHGTKSRYIDAICKNNFDWRLKGTSRGHKFGQGVSFSPSAFYAHHYGDVILLVRVLVGRCRIGNSLTIVPPTSIDTTTNGKDTVYVKYEDDDFYPEYIIHW